MNHTYKSIWNSTTGTFVAVSENATSAGKKSSPGATVVAGGSVRFTLKALAISLMLSFGTAAYALPVGGVVSAGTASISSAAGSTTITQSSQNAALNWQSFNIGKGEAVRFLQPNSSSVALNRVLGPDPSSILGSLSANGKVFLVNPNGILFGKGAQVNVGGLVASTLNISDNDFMAGRYQFSGSSSASVINQGAINADGGYVALLGANVGNDGTISAKLGTVALAAGNAITLDVAGDGLLNVAVNQGAVNALVQNGGLIQADGGQVQLSAQAAGNLLQSAVNNSGVIQAQTIENHNGTIRLLGDVKNGTVIVSGTLDASGTGVGQSGGNVTASGQHVGLVGANINVSGDAGGGTVLIGGDYQGKNPNIQNAAATFMSADSTISADAISYGNGGKVVLWANDATRAYGSISARGGAQGGDGGLIETSGHWLDVAGINVNASAAHGVSGTWLLDPNNITIQAAGAEANVTASPNFTSTNDFATVTTATIQTALNAGTSVNVTTSTGGTNAQPGDITVNDTLTWTAVTGPTLTLNAARDVTVNAAITATTGSLAVTAGRDVNINAATKTTTGSLSFNAVRDINLAAATTVVTGNLNAIAGGNVNVSATSTITTGDMVFRADNDGTGPGAAAGTVAVTCGNNCLTITTGTLHIRFNPASYATTGAEITAYDANLTGAGGLDAKAWVFGKGDNKIYDGTTAATVSSFKPDITSTLPPVALGAVTTPTFDTRDVGTNKLITYGSLFSHAAYDLFAPSGAPANTYTTRADILVRPLTISAVTDTRVYNGTTSSVGIPTSTGLQTGDTLNGPLTQAFTSKNVLGTGNSTLVAAGPYTVTDGNGGNNYTVTVNNAPGTITPLALVGGITAPNKVYDGNNSATIATRTLSTPVVGDTVGYVGGSATFSDKNAANGKTVTGTGLSLVGADAGNYTVNTTATTTANITPVPLTIQANDATKVYGQTFTPASTAFITSFPPIAGETVISVTETSTGSAPTASVAGSKYPITPSNAVANGAFLPSNYTITYVNGALTVTPAPLTIKANDATKVYGQTFTPSSTAFTIPVATQNGETVGSVTAISPTGTPATAAVPGPHAITPSAATGGTFNPTNYTITYANGALTVTPKALTGSITAADKTYDATTAAAITGRSLDGVVGTDVVTYTGGTAAFDTPVVGAGKTVTGTGLGLSGSDAGNYTVNPIATTTATIIAIVPVTPPVVVPPPEVVPPPVELPPIGVPPPVTPPVVVSPVTPPLVVPPVTPPGVVPPVTTPGVVPPVAPVVAPETTSGTVPSVAPEEMLGVEWGFVPLVAAPTWMPVVVPPQTPPQLLSVAQAVPAPVLPAAMPVETPVVREPIPVIAPVPTPPQIYVAPHHSRKQDRN